MNSSVQTQWCNFRLPTPFPNKTPVIWFLLEGWFYGVIYSLRSAREGVAGAQPRGHQQLSRVGEQHPIPLLNFLTILLFSLLFYSKKISPCTPTCEQPHNLSGIILHHPPWRELPLDGDVRQYLASITSTHWFPSPKITGSKANFTGCKREGWLNFRHLPNTRVSPMHSQLLLMQFWQFYKQNLFNLYIYI